MNFSDWLKIQEDYDDGDVEFHGGRNRWDNPLTRFALQGVTGVGDALDKAMGPTQGGHNAKAQDFINRLGDVRFQYSDQGILMQGTMQLIPQEMLTRTGAYASFLRKNNVSSQSELQTLLLKERERLTVHEIVSMMVKKLKADNDLQKVDINAHKVTQKRNDGQNLSIAVVFPWSAQYKLEKGGFSQRQR